METTKIFFYIIEGTRCFFLNPSPQYCKAQPSQAIVELCEKPKLPIARGYSSIGDTIPINNMPDTLCWGRLIDLQE